MKKEHRKMSGDSEHDEETIGFSIKDARHDLVNPFLSSGKKLQERILNPELRPLGEKKLRFRDWHSRSEVVLAGAPAESEQTEEFGKGIEEVALAASLSEESVDAELGKKQEDAVGEVERFPENFEECKNKVDSLVEELEEKVESLKEPEEIIEDVVESQKEIAESLEEPEKIIKALETQEEIVVTLKKPEEVVGNVESQEEIFESLEEPEGSEPFSQVQEIKGWMEEPEKFNIALEIEEPETVWQQWEDERGVPAEEIDGIAQSQFDSGKAVIAAEQLDAPVRRNRIITSSVSKGFGQG